MRTLNIQFLDLKSTDFRDLSQIKGLKLKSLDLRDSKVLSLKPLIGAEICEEVIVLPGQFHKREIENVSNEIKVIEKDFEQGYFDQIETKAYKSRNNGQKHHFIVQEEFDKHDLFWPLKAHYPTVMDMYAIIKTGGSLKNGYQVTLNGKSFQFFPTEIKQNAKAELVKVGRFELPEKGAYELKLEEVIGDENAKPTRFSKFIIEEVEGLVEQVSFKENTLSSKHVEIQGDFARFLNTPDRQCIGVWHGTSTILSWPIKIIEPGRLKVKALMAIPEEHIGGQVKVELGKESFVFDVPNTEEWGIFEIF